MRPDGVQVSVLILFGRERIFVNTITLCPLQRSQNLGYEVAKAPKKAPVSRTCPR
jgi:hypothetical protein